ncbi:MAG TPA: NB-ARC domain-containing protein [Gaiellaceae bacterium]|nr:NB-ARC domain-containing protein [Gaiellaceae bacterium]
MWTFVFTDVEGSTRLLHRLGATRYAAVLADHRRIVRSALGGLGGIELDTQGDSFFYVFESAAAALSACAAVVVDLEPTPIRVRVGVHSGPAFESPEGLVGVEVHRAARISAGAHGGQIVVSDTTRELVGGERLLDLGEFRLKDFDDAIRLYQLSGDGLEARFPPLRLAGARRVDLPVPGTPLLGRALDLERARGYLAEEVRVLTLTGAGGSGKTRLAIEVGRSVIDAYDDGVVFVGLAAISEAQNVLPAIARALGLRQLGAEPPEATLGRFLADRRFLLVLDNFEHVLDGAAAVGRLLRGAPRTQVLVTSRAPLRIDGEQELGIDVLAEEAAVELFLARGRSVRAGFEADEAAMRAIRLLVERLDRLPLALEIVATGLRDSDPELLLENLSSGVDAIGRGRRDVDTRQQTLQATLDWTYALLTERERRLLPLLGLFRGGFDRRAVAAVGGDVAGLPALVEWSLVRSQPRGRYLTLETVREYAEEKLAASSTAGEARPRYIAFALDLAREARAALFTPGAGEALAAVRADHANLLNALDHAAPEQRLQLVAALGRFWFIDGRLAEGRLQLERALVEPLADPAVLAQAVFEAGHFANHQGDREAASRQVVLLADLAARHRNDDLIRARAFLLEGIVGAWSGRDVTATLANATSLFMRRELYPEAAYADNVAGLAAFFRSQLDAADQHFERALSKTEQVGDPLTAALVRNNKCLVFHERDQIEAMCPLIRQALPLAAELDFRYVATWSLVAAAIVAVNRGETWDAVRLYGTSDRLRETGGAAIPPFFRPQYERNLNRARDDLGSAQLDAARDAGHLLSLNDAVELALHATAPTSPQSSKDSQE